MIKKKSILFMVLSVLFSLLFTAVFPFNVFAAIEDELAADKSRSNLFVNGDFSGDDLSNFRGLITVKEGEGIGGSNAVEVEQGSAAFYIFKDLQPSTAYTFVAYFKTFVMEGGDPPCIVIKGWGGDDIYSPAERTEDYMRAEYSFMTGEEVKAESEFHIWNVTAGTIMVDSMYLFLYEPQATEPPTDPIITDAPADERETDAADTAAAQENENKTEESDGNMNMTTIIIIIAAAVVVLLAIIIIVVFVGKKKKSKE